MFANQSASTPAQSNTGANGRGDFEKAKSFVNVYLPTVGGGRVKVGTMPLRESNKGEKAVHDHLTGAADEAELIARLTNLVSKMQFEFNLAEGKAVELAL